MRKMILLGLISCTLIGSSFATGFTQQDLSKLLLDKAVAENMIENRKYNNDEIITFVKEHDLFDFTDSNKEVSYKTVSSALSKFENIEAHFNEETVVNDDNEDVVVRMLNNVKVSKMVSPTPITTLEKLAEDEDTFICIGNYIEDGELKVGDYSNYGTAIKKAVKIGQSLQPHAEENDLMAAYIGGNGSAIGAAYGENTRNLYHDLEMFYIGYYRDVEWANEEEIDGKHYEFDKNVTIGPGLFANRRLLRAVPNAEERVKHRQEYIDMDEDVLNAFYDGLRVMDPSRAEVLFEKMTADYIYAKTHQYGDPNNSRKEFFEIDGQLIYQEDIRSDDGHYRYITYRFVK